MRSRCLIVLLGVMVVSVGCQEYIDAMGVEGGPGDDDGYPDDDTGDDDTEDDDDTGDDDTGDDDIQYPDEDGDGYTSDVDCNDFNADVYPGAPQICDAVLDNDCDGYIDETETDVDNDGFDECDGDCDDADATVHPGAIETACDFIDNDCDGNLHDEEVDDDGDGYTECAGDCDDGDPGTYPGAAEVCNGLDDDCSGAVPPTEDDDDGDGYRICAGDCDDTNPDISPGAPEICDGLDNDCSGAVPPWDIDQDGDGYSQCEGDCDDSDPALNLDDLDADSYSTCDGDCDDTNDEIHPGAPEVCDGLDNDCDPSTNEDVDADGDGWYACGGDCDDTNAAIHPGAPEICDGLDNDCSGIVPPWDIDADGDGWFACGGDCDDSIGGVYPGATEFCDGVDNDCDGSIDGPGCIPTTDDGTVCPSMMGTDDGQVPTWLGICDPKAGYHSYNGHCYFAVSSSANWPDARASCRDAGGHLVTIADAGENTFVANLSPRPHGGGCDADSEGTWAWITGEPWSYTNWSPGEPNNMGDEDCLEAPQGDYNGQWNDIWCNNNPFTAGYICEFE